MRSLSLVVLLILGSAILGNLDPTSPDFNPGSFVDDIEPSHSYMEDLSQNGICTDKLFTGLVMAKGYPVQTHKIFTMDGFQLIVFRIQAKGSNFTEPKKIVFLQHGMMDSSDTWILNDEDKSLAYFLANQGYDVWLGNARGNKYSRAHKIFGIKDPKYWDFSFHEMGVYDLVSCVDYILKKTKQATMNYIGHSQGASAIFAALTDSDTYEFMNKRISKVIGLGPVVYLANQEVKLLTEISKLPSLDKILNTLGLYHLFEGGCGEESQINKAQSFICTQVPKLCEFALSIADPILDLDNVGVLPHFAKHYPSGTSVKTVLHFLQMMKENKDSPIFRKYDYGASENMNRYGQEEPPVYDLSRIKVPIASILCGRDTLSVVRDNSILEENLKKLGVSYKSYFHSECGHISFVLHKNPELMYNDVLAELV